MKRAVGITILFLTVALVGSRVNLGSKQNEAAQPNESGLILWHTFDLNDYVAFGTRTSSTVKDYLNNGSAATVSKSIYQTVGQIGEAYNFNGDTNPENQSYIELGNRPDLAVSTSFSFSVWTKWDSVSTTAKRYIYSQSGNYGLSMYQGINSTQIACSFHPSDISLYPTVTSTPRLNDNEWHHTLCTYDGTQMKMWTDGVYTAGDYSTATVHYENYKATIGRKANDSARPFDGQMDDFRIYNVALSTSSVLTIYNEGKIGAKLPRR